MLETAVGQCARALGQKKNQKHPKPNEKTCVMLLTAFCEIQSQRGFELSYWD